MPRIEKPLLAAKFEKDSAKYPYLGSPKIDGLRCLMVNGKALSRTFKPIRNKYTQEILSKNLPNGIDCELTCGTNFQDSTSGIMTIEGVPNFTAWVFDYIEENRDGILPYEKRLEELHSLKLNFPWMKILAGKLLRNYDELVEYEEECLAAGFEGIIVRDPLGEYKFGRATVRENIILKVKRFLDDEAEIIGFDELMTNENEALKDAFGRTKRSSSQAGKYGAGTLGKVLVRNKDGIEFGIGSGFDEATRSKIWHNKMEYLGKMVKYKYLPYGTLDRPRHPVFLQFRHEDDI
jgi:DNA ligase-1